MMVFVAAVPEELGELPGFSLGVGSVAAGIAMAERLAELRPERVVLVGTVGAFRADMPVGSVWAAEKLGWSDPLKSSKTGYVPLPPPEMWVDPLPIGLSGARVLTSLGVTTDAKIVADYGENWDLEHMEVGAVALACQRRGVPFGAILGVANRVGPGAHAEWRANRGMVESRVRAHAQSLIK